MSSSPLFRRKPATPTSPSPSSSPPRKQQAQAQAQAQQSPAPKSPSKKYLLPPLPSSSSSPSPKTPHRRASDISLPSAITSATHIATTPLLPSGVLHSYNSNNKPGESSSTPATVAAAATAAAREVPDTPMFLAKPSSSSSPGAGSGGGGGCDAHEKMWAEMQQKLQEVELSADHVFGSSHAKSLEELRAAQIALAQAWMRSEEEEEEEGGGGLDGEHVEFGRGAFGRDLGKGKGVAGAASGGGGGGGGDMLETEGDILLARKRRLANDEHFARVARSVQDVTRRLETVAEAMACVEMESRGIWAGGTESDGTSIR